MGCPSRLGTLKSHEDCEYACSLHSCPIDTNGDVSCVLLLHNVHCQLLWLCWHYTKDCCPGTSMSSFCRAERHLVANGDQADDFEAGLRPHSDNNS